MEIGSTVSLEVWWFWHRFSYNLVLVIISNEIGCYCIIIIWHLYLLLVEWKVDFPCDMPIILSNICFYTFHVNMLLVVFGRQTTLKIWELTFYDAITCLIYLFGSWEKPGIIIKLLLLDASSLTCRWWLFTQSELIMGFLKAAGEFRNCSKNGINCIEIV